MPAGHRYDIHPGGYHPSSAAHSNGVSRSVSEVDTSLHHGQPGYVSPVKQGESMLSKLRRTTEEARLREEQEAAVNTSRPVRWFEGPITSVASPVPDSLSFTRQHQHNTSVVSPARDYGSRPQSGAPVSVIESQRHIAQNMEMQLATMMDQQHALFSRSLSEFESRIMSAISRLDNRLCNVEDICRGLERVSATELKAAKLDAQALNEKLTATAQEKESLARRLVAAAPTPTRRAGSPGVVAGGRYRTPTERSGSALRNLVAQVTQADQAAASPQQYQPSQHSSETPPLVPASSSRVKTPSRAPPPVPNTSPAPVPNSNAVSPIAKLGTNESIASHSGDVEEEA